MDSEFADLVAVVTGGASGIGLATARLLAVRGARVACLDVAFSEIGPRTDSSDSLPTPLLGVPCDVTDSASVGTAVDAVVSRLGRLDIRRDRR